VTIDHVDNPRVEAERHYYNAKHTKLLDLGLKPSLLSEELIDTMLRKIQEHRSRVDESTILQGVRWVPGRTAEAAPGA
jgi:UDP-sulfoquinovose synthase